ncbi:hypothetical protein Lser_V15G01196 [Lactuca serriola]
MATCQAIWMCFLLAEITRQQVALTTLHVDNKSMLDLMKNYVFHGLRKYTDALFHFIKECVENAEVRVTHAYNKEQRSDILTKTMAQVKHKEMRVLIGIEQAPNSGVGGEYCHNPDLVSTRLNKSKPCWIVVPYFHACR